MDLFSHAQQQKNTQKEQSNLPEMSISDLSNALKKTVEDRFSYVRLRGEVSQPKKAASGHIYLRLKDDKAVLDAICWRGVAQKLSIQPEEGMDVIVTGRLTTYPGRSSYQIIIETLELAGEGALLKLLEERRKKLAAEGLFDLSKKKKLPFLPKTIGIITSPTGAVIRDIMHRLRDRFPTHVLLWGVNVQGEAAPVQIAKAIEGFNQFDGKAAPKPDLLIVARGGGSLEDLMAFNEEIVVRAAAASKIPLISAVGHETDTTLIDFASDKRAPTPTAAAEIAVPVRRDLTTQLKELDLRHTQSMWRRLEDAQAKLESYSRGLAHPNRLIEPHIQRLDFAASKLQTGLTSLVERSRSHLNKVGSALPHPGAIVSLKTAQYQASSKAFSTALRNTASRSEQKMVQVKERLNMLQERSLLALETQLKNKQTALSQQEQLLKSYSYHNVLKRGFSLVTNDKGEAVTSASALGISDNLNLHFGDQSTASVEVRSTQKK